MLDEVKPTEQFLKLLWMRIWAATEKDWNVANLSLHRHFFLVTSLISKHRSLRVEILFVQIVRAELHHDESMSECNYQCPQV
jgi:hypothetical protein